MPWQYSSFNENDPNSTRFPAPTDPSYQDSLQAAEEVLGVADTTRGATRYYDKSLDPRPPKWATDGSDIHTAILATCVSGRGLRM